VTRIAPALAALALALAGCAAPAPKSAATAPAVAGVQGSSDRTGVMVPAAADVKLTRCVTDANRLPTATFTVHNPVSKDASYSVTIDVLDTTGVRVQQLVGVVMSVTPGGTARATAPGFEAVTGKFTCKVSGAQRTAL